MDNSYRKVISWFDKGNPVNVLFGVTDREKINALSAVDENDEDDYRKAQLVSFKIRYRTDLCYLIFDTYTDSVHSTHHLQCVHTYYCMMHPEVLTPKTTACLSLAL